MPTLDETAAARAAIADRRWHTTMAHNQGGHPWYVYTTGLTEHRLPELFMQVFSAAPGSIDDDGYRELRANASVTLINRVAALALSGGLLGEVLTDPGEEWAIPITASTGHTFTCTATNHPHPEDQTYTRLMDTTRAVYPNGFAVATLRTSAWTHPTEANP